MADVTCICASGREAPHRNCPVHGAGAINEDALTAAHLAVEDRLIGLRDARISMIGHANGFVVREANGEASSIIRVGSRDGLRFGIAAYLAALEPKS